MKLIIENEPFWPLLWLIIGIILISLILMVISKMAYKAKKLKERNDRIYKIEIMKKSSIKDYKDNCDLFM